ncbi:MAG: cell division protein FtsZ [Candidatus Eremiobacterota bacterium]
MFAPTEIPNVGTDLRVCPDDFKPCQKGDIIMEQQKKGKWKNSLSIKVVGVGGAASNAVSNMFKIGVKGIEEFLCIDTDIQQLNRFKANVKILPIGFKVTGGFSTGTNPELGRMAAEENCRDIAEAFEGADMIFIIACMGGGAGTGASHVIAEIARNTGALTIGVVTKPFPFEIRQNTQKVKIANEGMEKIKKHVNTLITLSNEKLLKIIYNKSPSLQVLEKVDGIEEVIKDIFFSSFLQVLKSSDDMLIEAIRGISDLIGMPGDIAIAFPDIRNVMCSANDDFTYMGIGTGTGNHRAINAAIASITSPLLEESLKRSRWVIANIKEGGTISTSDINSIYEIFLGAAKSNSTVVVGTTLDETMEDDIIKITVFVST